MGKFTDDNGKTVPTPDLTSIHLEALKRVSQRPAADLDTDIAVLKHEVLKLGREVASSKTVSADHYTILGHTVAIVTTMIQANKVLDVLHDVDTGKTTYLDDPIGYAIKTVYAALSATQNAQQTKVSA